MIDLTPEERALIQATRRIIGHPEDAGLPPLPVRDLWKRLGRPLGNLGHWLDAIRHRLRDGIDSGHITEFDLPPKAPRAPHAWARVYQGPASAPKAIA